MNLYEYEYDVHEPYDYEKVHEYDTYDYESLWAVWTKIVKSMNLYEYEYEPHDYESLWTVWTKFYRMHDFSWIWLMQCFL